MSHELNTFWYSTTDYQMTRVSLNVPLKSFQKGPCSRLDNHASVLDVSLPQARFKSLQVDSDLVLKSN